MRRSFWGMLRAYLLTFKNKPGYALKGSPGKRRWHRVEALAGEGMEESVLKSAEGEVLGSLEEVYGGMSWERLGEPKLLTVSAAPILSAPSPNGEVILKPVWEPRLEWASQSMGIDEEDLVDMVDISSSISWEAATVLGAPVVPSPIIFPDERGGQEYLAQVEREVTGGKIDQSFLRSLPEGSVRAEFEQRAAMWTSYWQNNADRLYQTPWIVTPFVERAQPMDIKDEEVRNATLRLLGRHMVAENVVGYPDRNFANYVNTVVHYEKGGGEVGQAVLPVPLDFAWLPPGWGICSYAYDVRGRAPLRNIDPVLYPWAKAMGDIADKLRSLGRGDEIESIARGKIPKDPHPLTRGFLDVAARMPDLDSALGNYYPEVRRFMDDFWHHPALEPIRRVGEEWDRIGD